MKVLVDVSSLIKTCLYAGKDPEAILASDSSQVNSARWGYDNTVNSLVATLDYLKCVPSDIVFAVEGFHSKSRRQHIDKGYKQDAVADAVAAEREACEGCVEDLYEKLETPYLVDIARAIHACDKA